MSRRLEASFYDQPTRDLAKSLLGKLLIRKVEPASGQPLRLSGIVVEVEAYLSSGDPASHSQRGQGYSNASMFGQPGTLYVYPIHSRHCLNVVSEPTGHGAAVLIRAIEPLEGSAHMAELRGLDCKLPAHSAGGTPSVSSIRDAIALTTGPGRLCQALQVDRRLDGVNLLVSQQVWFEDYTLPQLGQAWRRRSSPRIGISQAKERRLRWFLDGHRFVSGCARDHSAGRTWTFGHG